MSKPAKYCDECKHYVDQEDESKWRDVCGLNHKPRFFIPQTMSQAHSKNWGWKRRCGDFVPTSEVQP